jgi:flagellar basal body-associated protein FliL
MLPFGNPIDGALMSQPPQPPYSGQPNDPYSGQPGQPPYPGQPYSGQPNPDVPTSVPPQPGYPPTTAYQAPGQPDYAQPQAPQFGQPAQYGQPDYAQPGYGQPGYGQPGYPPVLPQPQKKSKALPIILVTIAIVLVLCVGGVTALYIAGKGKVDEVKKAIDTAASATPTVPSDTGTPEATTPTTAPASTVKIVEPKTLGGRSKVTDASLTATTKTMKSALLDEYTDATSSFGGFYGVPAKRNLVMALAVAAPIPDPEREVTKNFAGMGVSGSEIKNVTTVSTGSLGGTAKCGSAVNSGINLAVCSWADEGSSGMLVWYYKSVSKAKAEFPALRAQIEKKG